MQKRQEVFKSVLPSSLQTLLDVGFAFLKTNRRNPSTPERDPFYEVKLMRTATAYHKTVVGNLVDRVVGDFIVPTLRDKNGR